MSSVDQAISIAPQSPTASTALMSRFKIAWPIRRGSSRTGIGRGPVQAAFDVLVEALAGEFNALIDKLRQIGAGNLGLNFAGKLQNLADQHFEPLDAGGDFGHELQRSGLLGDVAGEHGGVEFDAAERIANLVGHSRGHFTEGGETFAAFELAIFFGEFVPQRLDGLLKLGVRILELLGQVTVDADDAAEFFDACSVGGDCVHWSTVACRGRLWRCRRRPWRRLR